ncbi:MAG: ABC transporter permease [Planctomycetota bacterium]|nr:ABC transporter permease [Planctomycetota bacterium]
MLTRPSLALFTRVLRADTRANWTYITRIAFFAFLLFAIYGTYKGRNQLQAPGKTLFAGIVVVDFMIITLLAVSSFATSITEEKELGTLGLLRMTRVTPLAILLGKWGSRLFSVFLLLIAQCPFTILSVAFGGITLTQILAVHLSLSAYLVLTSSIALFASVVSRRNGEAVFFTIALLVIFFLTPWILSFFSSSQGARYLLYQLSILFPTDMLQKKNYANWQSQLFYNHMLFSYGTSLVLLTVSTLSFDYFNREGKPGKAPSDVSAPLEDASEMKTATASPSKQAKSRRSWAFAHVWFEFTYTAGGVLHWLTRVTFALGFLVFVHYSYPNMKEWRLFQWILSGEYTVRNGHLYYHNSQAWVLFQGFAFLFLAHLAHGYSVTIQEELRGQTLSSLTLFPVPLPQIFRQKLLGLTLAHSPYLVGLIISVMILFAQGSPLAGDLLSVRGLLLFSLSAFFVHLVAYLSLWIRWGAFFAGFGFILLTHICYRFDNHILLISLSLLCASFALFFKKDILGEWQRQSSTAPHPKWSRYRKVIIALFSLVTLAFFGLWSLSIFASTMDSTTKSPTNFNSVGLVLLIAFLGFLFTQFRLTTPPTVALLISLVLIPVQLMQGTIIALLSPFASIEEVTIILLCIFGGQLLKLHTFATLDHRARE